MVIYLPGQSADDQPLLDELTPREIVRELDKYVVGQADAKRAVAIALRNRIRRQKLDPDMADEVMPKNILMIGPTGVGKTELARRLRKARQLPVSEGGSQQVHRGRLCRPRRRIDDPRPGGYRHRHGARGAPRRSGRARRTQAEERLLDLLMPPQAERARALERTREKLREQLRAGKLDERMVEIDVKERGPTFEISTSPAWRRWTSTSRTSCPASSASARASATCAWPRPSNT